MMADDFISFEDWLRKYCGYEIEELTNEQQMRAMEQYTIEVEGGADTE